MRKIYVASSWRNTVYPHILQALRDAGHQCYDFRNPGPDDHGFAWSQIDPGWQDWSMDGYAEALEHPIAQAGFGNDRRGLDWCDTCVLVLPCGRSAHIEAGYAIGQGKQVFILLHEDKFEPELMYLLAGPARRHVFSRLDSLLTALQKSDSIPYARRLRVLDTALHEEREMRHEAESDVRTLLTRLDELYESLEQTPENEAASEIEDICRRLDIPWRAAS
jgi:nucleoside 2-deoxyribosyltransferase